MLIVGAWLIDPMPASARPVRIVALGDSLTAGYMLPSGADFPDVLQTALRAKGYDVEVTNAGVSGDTASAGLERLDWSVAEGTDLVMLELGANDMLRGIDPDLTRAALEQIVSRLIAKRIKVLILGMLASPNMGEPYRTRFDRIFPELADKYRTEFYPFVLAGVVGDPALSLADGMHPNRAGVEIIVGRLLPTVDSLLRSIVANR